MRWLKEPNFLNLSEEQVEEEVAKAKTVAELVPKAVNLLDNALDGLQVSNAQIRAALEVVKASNVLKVVPEEDRKESLAEVISKLDAEGHVQGD